MYFEIFLYNKIIGLFLLMPLPSMGGTMSKSTDGAVARETEPCQTELEPESCQTEPEPEPCQMELEPCPMEPEPCKTEPELCQTEPEPCQTEPEPCQTETELEPCQTRSHVKGSWGHVKGSQKCPSSRGSMSNGAGPDGTFISVVYQWDNGRN